jgi:hypothetical protein
VRRDGDRNERRAGGRDSAGRVGQPYKVARLAAAAREVLTELRDDDLGHAARNRAGVVYQQSLEQLSTLLSEGLRAELRSLVDAHRAEREGGVPSTGELRVAEAQLAGWLEGLLQEIEISRDEESVRSRRALEQERRAVSERRDSRRRARDTSYL